MIAAESGVTEREFRFSAAARALQWTYVVVLTLAAAFCLYGLFANLGQDIARVYLNAFVGAAAFLGLNLWGLYLYLKRFRIRDGRLEIHSLFGVKRLDLSQARIRVATHKSGRTNRHVIAPEGSFFLARDSGLAELVDYLEATLPYEADAPIPQAGDEEHVFKPPRWQRLLYLGSIPFWFAWVVFSLYAAYWPNLPDADRLHSTSLIMCLAGFGGFLLLSIYAAWQTAYTLTLSGAVITRKRLWQRPLIIHLAHPEQVIWKPMAVRLQDGPAKLTVASNAIVDFDAFAACIERAVDYPPLAVPEMPYAIPLRGSENSWWVRGGMAGFWMVLAIYFWFFSGMEFWLRVPVTLALAGFAVFTVRERSKQLKAVIATPEALIFEYYGRTETKHSADLEQIAYLPSQLFITCVFRDGTVAIPAHRCVEPAREVCRSLRALYFPEATP